MGVRIKKRSPSRIMLVSAGLDGSCDGEAPAGGGEGRVWRVEAPGGWLSVMGGEFGRLGRR